MTLNSFSGEKLEIGGSLHGGKAEDRAGGRAGRRAGLLHLPLQGVLLHPLPPLL